MDRDDGNPTGHTELLSFPSSHLVNSTLATLIFSAFVIIIVVTQAIFQ